MYYARKVNLESLLCIPQLVSGLLYQKYKPNYDYTYKGSFVILNYLL